MFRRSLLLTGVLLLLVAAVLPGHARANNPPLVVLQAGHWHSEALADEFARLRTSTGAVAGGVREVDLNVDIAHRVAVYLRDWGNEAYVLPADIPPHYHADAFVALHSDGNNDTSAHGYKVATYWRDWVATDWLVRELDDEYGKDTGLARDWRITANMRGYYAFDSGLYEHTIAEDTPGAILEMGFLSNPAERGYMIANRDLIARSVALGIARFLATKPATGWPAPQLLPRGDIVAVLHDNVPLFATPDASTESIDTAWEGQHFAVTERRTGWAKLFFYGGAEEWIQDWQTKQIVVP
ncbi:MAG: N-acetylmuramoyl-L-alanine amidase [Herpetosiphonaceae bacterium]|nr:N-acetylmuramoyl-L-alanine amidase [Herpetosiphonaceae bacterium]